MSSSLRHLEEILRDVGMAHIIVQSGFTPPVLLGEYEGLEAWSANLFAVLPHTLFQNSRLKPTKTKSPPRRIFAPGLSTSSHSPACSVTVKIKTPSLCSRSRGLVSTFPGWALVPAASVEKMVNLFFRIQAIACTHLYPYSHAQGPPRLLGHSRASQLARSFAQGPLGPQRRVRWTSFSRSRPRLYARDPGAWRSTRIPLRMTSGPCSEDLKGPSLSSILNKTRPLDS